MIKISFDKEINGDLLVQEFLDAGFMTDVVVFPNGLLELNGLNDSQITTAQDIVDRHIAPKSEIIGIKEKLASIGLSIDDLKVALGL